jgi:predicted nucleic acid-binding protein
LNGYLLDTSVLSMFAPGRGDATPELLAWVGRRGPELFISAVSVAEIEQGIAKLERMGSRVRADATSGWLDRTLVRYADNVLLINERVARAAGRLTDRAIARGKPHGLADVYIAATARTHDLTVMTRNIKHFAPLEVAVLDPILSLPD